MENRKVILVNVGLVFPCGGILEDIGPCLRHSTCIRILLNYSNIVAL